MEPGSCQPAELTLLMPAGPLLTRTVQPVVFTEPIETFWISTKFGSPVLISVMTMPAAPKTVASVQVESSKSMAVQPSSPPAGSRPVSPGVGTW